MICKATPADCHALAELALLLWSEHSIDDLIEEFSETLPSENVTFFSQICGRCARRLCAVRPVMRLR